MNTLTMNTLKRAYLRPAYWQLTRDLFGKYPILACVERQHRTLSSTRSINGTSQGKSRDSVVLYERNTEMNKFPRAALSLTYFSSCYWTWYAVDFIPTVNQSPIPDLHVSPWVGVAGCTIAYAVTAVACVYSSQMVSKVVLQRDSQSPIHIYCHSLPLMMPSANPREYKFGDASLDYTSNEVKKLIDAVQSQQSGQQQSSKKIIGHLPLHANDRRWPLGLYVTSMNDIKDKDLFLDTLLFASLYNEEKELSKKKATTAASNFEEPDKESTKLPLLRRLKSKKKSRRK